MAIQGVDREGLSIALTYFVILASHWLETVCFDYGIEVSVIVTSNAIMKLMKVQHLASHWLKIVCTNY